MYYDNNTNNFHENRKEKLTCKTFKIGLTVFQVVPLMSITTEKPRSAASSLKFNNNNNKEIKEKLAMQNNFKILKKFSLKIKNKMKKD